MKWLREMTRSERRKPVLSKPWRILIAISCLALLFPIRSLRQQWHDIHYPHSTAFLSPTGIPDPTLEKYLKDKIFVQYDGVHIEMGDMANDNASAAALRFLSPVVRMNPDEAAFKFIWTYSAGSSVADFQVKYDRTQGEATFSQVGADGHRLTDPNAAIHTRLLGRNLTDLDIHEAAAKTGLNMDFDQWATRHWQK